MDTYNPLGSPLVNPDGREHQQEATTPAVESEFDRFENLAHRVVNVPKTELEEGDRKGA